MAFKGLDHVVVRVKNLDTAIDGYTKILGIEPKRASSSALKAEQAFFYFGNGTFLELIQPTDDSSPIAGSLNKLGEGVHTVAFAIDDREATVKAAHRQRRAHDRRRVRASRLGERRARAAQREVSPGVTSAPRPTPARAAESARSRQPTLRASARAAR